MNAMTSLPYRLDRTVLIQAAPALVFRFLTDTPYWARWWGAGSTIDARPGGRLLIRYPDGTEASGEVLEVQPPEKIVFTYGYVSGKLIPAGGSRITIRLAPETAGTRLNLTHEVADAAVRDEHVQGWRYQFSLFANVVADEVNAGAERAVDTWFDAWAEPDPAARERALTTIAARDVRFRDRFSNVAGIDDLMPHLAAAQRFMPGIRMKRTGNVRHCQGTALADWVALATGDEERARGTNVFVFGPTGKIESVTGLWTV
jgi:uncharacterized protein YndB with AHSA1/START domain